MRAAKDEKLKAVLKCMDSYCAKGIYPSIRDIAAGTGISKSMVHEYLKELQDSDLVRYDIETESYITPSLDKISREDVCVPLLGSVSCGPPEQAGEENIDEYLRFPRDLLGRGDYYILKASGNSMEDIGIDSGDMVIIRNTKEAKDGDIIVARVEGSNDFTLKRFVSGKEGTYLHPENKSMKDMHFNEIEVFGVAVKVIKNL